MKMTVEKIYSDLAFASEKQAKLNKEMEKDFEYALGKQWDDKDVRELESVGVRALTINKIKPMIKLLSGIERQSRSDFQAYPEGGEDVLVSEIVTRLLKNVVKTSSLDRRTSDQFKEGVTCGLCYIEPYMDYTYDLINGQMRFRKVNASDVFVDPSGDEYDLSDRRYVIKITTGLSREDLEYLFPDNKKIKSLKPGRITDRLKSEKFSEHFQVTDYEMSEDKEVQMNGDDPKDLFDLVEYYYKSAKKMFYLVGKEDGKLAEFETMDELNKFVEENQVQNAAVIEKSVPEIRLAQVVSDKILYDDVAWCYPRWKFYPIIPFCADVMSVNIKNKELLVQGIVRSLRDLQNEFNKRRTQELRHLNSTANSGWMFPKGMLDTNTLAAFKKFGASPGFTAEYDKEKAGGTVAPENFRIYPARLSDGHRILAAEAEQDIKNSSGVNPDLLANDSQSQSGRAILLKQRQGLVMVQEVLDNFSYTKKIIGRFILSQLGEIYTVETALRVLGDAFIKENFEEPVLDEMGRPTLDENGKLRLDVRMPEVMILINKILNDSSLGKYDVSIGEGAYSETIKFANFTMLMDMVSKGIPVPPDVIIQESTLAEGHKKKIMDSIASARQAQQQQIAQPNPSPQGDNKNTFQQ